MDRRIKVTLEVDAKGAVKLLDDTGAAAAGAADQFDKLGKSASKNEQAIKDAGVALTAIGAGGVTALGLASKAAIDWESAWAGVTKTVDGTNSQLADLEDGLRSMARELPATHTEIAGVAEAAGQLGVSTEDIESFTSTMIDLGETTNLSADQAATSIAQMTNIMQTAPEDVDNLASALVALGNDGASTESQIVQMAQGMAGAAAIVGMTESDVLAVANAFASVGIEVEAGGSSFSRIITDMSKAAAQGGDDLETFARVAGVSAEDFATAFREDPAQAFATFIKGLGRMQSAGEDVFTVLDDLGMSDVRVSRALLGMATSGDLLTDSLELGNDAWEKNTALADEAAKRYETTAAQIDIARGNINDAAISFGEVLLPAVVNTSEVVADLAGWLADLPGPAKEAAIGIGAVTTAASLLVGGSLLAIPKLQDMHKTFKTIQTSAPRAATAIRGVGIAAGIMAGAILAEEIGDAIGDWVSRNDDVDQLADAIRGVGDAAEFAQEKVAWMTRDGLLNSEELVTGAEAMDRFAESAQIAFADGFWDKAGRIQSPGSLDRFIENAQGLDQALAELVNNGHADKAADLFDQFWSRVENMNGVTMEEVMQGFSMYEEAMRGAGEATQETLDKATAWDNATFPDLAPQMTDNARAIQEQGEAMAESEQAAEELARSYGELLGGMASGADNFVSLTGALSETQTKAQEWAQSQADATETADDSWQDFYDGFSVNLDDYLAELQSMVDAQTNWQDNLSSLTGRLSRETLEELAKLGPEAAPLVQALVDGTDAQLREFEANFVAGGADAAAGWAEGFESEQAVADVAAASETLSGAANRKILEGLQSGELSAAEAVLKYDLKAELEVAANTDPAAADVLAEVEAIESTVAVAQVGADVGLATAETDGWVTYTMGQRPVPLIDADSSPADEVTDSWYRYAASQHPVATYDADGSDAYGSVDGWESYTNTRSATVMVYANTSNLYDAVGSAVYWIRSQRPVVRVGMNPVPVATGGPIMLAAGGPVHGPGTGTSDDVPAYNRDTGTPYALSNGEHVLTATEVNAAGGHAEVYRLRKALLARAVQFDVGGATDMPVRGDRVRALTAAAPRVPTPVVHVDGNTASFDYDQLAQAMSRTNIALYADSMKIAQTTRRGENQIGPAGTWYDKPRIGRTGATT